MIIKRYRILLLLLCVLYVITLFGCHQNDLTELYPKLYRGITYFDGGVVFRIGHTHLNSYYVEAPDAEDNKEADRYYDASELQKAVKHRTRGLVLDNDATILAYAWELQPILIEFSCIPPNYDPVAAEHYANGVVWIEYAGNTSIETAETLDGKSSVTYDDSAISVFVSEADGHIIHITSY